MATNPKSSRQVGVYLESSRKQIGTRQFFSSIEQEQATASTLNYRLSRAPTTFAKTAPKTALSSKLLGAAVYVLRLLGPMPTMKLHKLLYYSQAWSIVWDDEPLFEDRVEAWANGPVIPRLFAMHRGKFRIQDSDILGDPGVLSAINRESIDAVLSFYGDKDPYWLSELTHSEAPWRDARKGLANGERGNVEITPEAMAGYYSLL